MLCWGFLVLFACEPTATPPVIVGCPNVPTWSRAFQRQLAGEIAGAKPGSATGQAMREHIRLRDQARRCRAGRSD
jgi:hypothetical protein